MKFGAYNAVLHNLDLTEAITCLSQLGLEVIELNSGGFLPATHIPNFDQILVSDVARDEFLDQFENTGVAIGGLNCNGNPLHRILKSVTSTLTMFAAQFGWLTD